MDRTPKKEKAGGKNLGSVQSRRRASMTARFTCSICGVVREPSFLTTTERSMTAVRSPLITEVVLRPVEEKSGSCALRTTQVS